MKLFKNKIDKGNILAAIIINLLILASSCFCSVSFSGNSQYGINAFSKTIASISQNNFNNKIYATNTVFDKNNNQSVAKNIFLRNYPDNFSYHFLQTTAYCKLTQDNEMASFDLFCQKTLLNECKWLDNINYSNQVDLKRFETININLYKKPNKKEEFNSYGCDGVIYIPDYFADMIIENSNGDLSTYDDLLPDFYEFDDKSIKEFLDKYSIIITNDEKTIGRFKISNIFRVNNFTKTNDLNINYNDLNNGLTIQKMIGNYFFSFKNPGPDYTQSLITIVDSKQFIINSILSGYNSLKDKYLATFKFYQVSEFGTSVIVEMSDLINTIFLSSESFNYIFFIFLIITACILLYLLFISKRFKKFKNKQTLFILFMCYIFVNICFQSASVLFSNAYIFNLFYNSSFNIVSLFLFCITCIKFFKYRENKQC